MTCYFCHKSEKMIPRKWPLKDGRHVNQCSLCFVINEKNLAVFKKRGIYHDQSQLSVSTTKPTTSSGGIGNGGDTNMKVEKDATGGDFLKASYVKEHKISELLIIGDAQIAKFEGKDDKTTEKLQFKVQYEGYQENKEMPDTWTMNSKSKNAIIDAWGDDTDDWKAKPIPITLSGDGDYLHIKVDELRIK